MKNNIQHLLNENKKTNTYPSTQKELAAKVGVRREYINRIINGGITPAVSLAMRIAEALGINVREEGIGKVFVL